MRKIGSAIVLLLGVVQNSRGKIDEANRRYRRALDLSPKNPLAANNLAANLAEHGGNLDEALKWDKENVEIQNALAELRQARGETKDSGKGFTLFRKS